LTVYDASYLSLAKELDTSFITADRELAEKAGRHVKARDLAEY